ncbi:MAG: TetR/AcrR family transcriptional regulator [Actinomycetota bacterium]|nr:TetR/AcrR family transcriptional regulator [Actinomycetota bacterium]
MKQATAPRQTADERRVAVLDAATHEFGLRGLHGASTEDIAHAAGISQPYLFRLFGSKKELYLAACQRCIDELYTVFARAADGHSGQEALHAMGEAYTELMQDHDRLMLMLKSWTSSDDPDIARVTRSGWRNLVDLAEQSSGEPASVVSRFFADGMLITIFMSLNLVEDPEPWSTRLLEACKDNMTT